VDTLLKILRRTAEQVYDALVYLLAFWILYSVVTLHLDLEVVRGVLAGTTSSLGAILTGSVTILPAYVAFPMVKNLSGLGLPTAVAAGFSTSLMMVNLLTLPLEVHYLGARFALFRNAMALLAAFATALVFGVFS
jgi:uncharacterized membrane protein YraQ (UPF0718 family)